MAYKMKSSPAKLFGLFKNLVKKQVKSTVKKSSKEWNYNDVKQSLMDQFQNQQNTIPKPNLHPQTGKVVTQKYGKKSQITIK